MPNLPAACAASWAAAESWCWAISWARTGVSSSASAASFSSFRSNQVSVQRLWTFAVGLVFVTPSAKAFSPRKTSGIGKAAT